MDVNKDTVRRRLKRLSIILGYSLDSWELERMTCYVIDKVNLNKRKK